MKCIEGSRAARDVSGDLLMGYARGARAREIFSSCGPKGGSIVFPGVVAACFLVSGFFRLCNGGVIASGVWMGSL